MSELNNLSIKQWAMEDRPREKLLAKGIAALTDAELIAILIGSGTRDETAVDIAKRILGSVENDLNELGKKQVTDLKKIKGIGEAKAITIIASLELGRRRKLATLKDKTQITSSSDIYNLFQPVIAELPHEEFWAVYLNRSNKIIEKTKLSQGGVAGTVIDIKLVLKNALQLLASSIIVCHNHPSGNLQPSQADKDITTKLAKAANLLDIKVLDHIIVVEDNYYSFADNNLM